LGRLRIVSNPGTARVSIGLTRLSNRLNPI
jgi:hypothetical protein